MPNAHLDLAKTIPSKKVSPKGRSDIDGSPNNAPSVSRNAASICIVGLGYVGLPLAVAFGRTEHRTMGYDISSEKVDSLKAERDPNDEVTPEELANTNVEYSDSPEGIAEADIIIAAIPTPIDAQKTPNLGPIRGASQTIGKHMKKGSIVVYESTVYPGLTEEVCVPILEAESGLKFGVDFEVGYSPERINPGDKEHTLENITKIVAGSTPETLNTLAELYGEVVKAGIHRAPSLKVAEAAKVIENIQRDLNIGLMNELSVIFRKLGIDTQEVLKAAGTKWNFHAYRPGLVGGHCIGVDPYYLTHKAESIGHHPQIILAGREVNDRMAAHVAQMMEESLREKGRSMDASRVLVLGVTFKENVADVRNSKAKDLIRCLKEKGATVFAHDPMIESETIQTGFEVDVMDALDEAERYDGIILFSPHRELVNAAERIVASLNNPGVFIDIKAALKGAIQPSNEISYQTL